MEDSFVITDDIETGFKHKIPHNANENYEYFGMDILQRKIRQSYFMSKSV